MSYDTEQIRAALTEAKAADPTMSAPPLSVEFLCFAARTPSQYDSTCRRLAAQVLELHLEVERLRAAGRALLETLDKHSTGSFGEAEDTLRELTTPPAPVERKDEK